MAACPAAEDALYELVRTSARYFFLRQFGVDRADDLVPELYMAVLKSIRSGAIREAECLGGYLDTIARRLSSRAVREISFARSYRRPLDETFLPAGKDGNPELECQHEEQNELMRRVLSRMTEQEREILRRFYLEEQSADRICCDLGLSRDQFRLAKWRAKAHFGALGKRRLEGPEGQPPAIRQLSRAIAHA